MAVFEYYNAHQRCHLQAGRPAAEAYADRAANLAGSAAELAFGAARATRAYLAIQRSDYEMALQCAVEGHRIAVEQGSEALALRSETMSACMSLALQRWGRVSS